jgi:DnaK suppressor protein
MSTLAMPKISGSVQEHTEDLATHLPELRMMLEEQRRFRIDQLHINERHLHDDTTDEHHVDVLDTSADNARVEVDAAVQAAARLALEDIETALERMGDGRYGSCAQCTAPIPVERLLAIPQAPLCMNCQRRAEHRR